MPMDSSTKQRVVGAVVLIALAVIFLPMLVKGPAPASGVSDVPLGVPAEPRDADGMVTTDLPLAAPAAAPAGGAVGMPGAVTEPAAPAPAAQTDAAPAVAAGDFAVSFGSYATGDDADKVIGALKAANLPAWRERADLNGRQVERVRIGPFADRALAESARLRAGQVNANVDARVIALNAPAAEPAAAAAAPAPVPAKPQPQPAAPVAAKPEPLKSEPPKPAAPVAKPADKPAAVAAKPADAKPEAAKPEPPAAKPADTGKTGFAVQVGAFSSSAEATKLRDKLRAAGFNAFTDTVPSDKGTLTRVRVGPAMTRAEADALKASVQAKLGIAGMVRPHP